MILTRDGAQFEPVKIKNLALDPNLPANAQIGTDFLQLVRYGLRRADDPSISDSVKVVDRLLKTDTPSGPVWHRYNDDGYGEHDEAPRSTVPAAAAAGRCSPASADITRWPRAKMSCRIWKRC